MSLRSKRIFKFTGATAILAVAAFFAAALRPLPKSTTIVESNGYRLITTHERRYQMHPIGSWKFGSGVLKGCGPSCSTEVREWRFGFVSSEDDTTHCSETL